MTIFYKTYYNSPIGILSVVCDEFGNITGLWIKGQRYYEESLSPNVYIDKNVDALSNVKKWLDKYFNGYGPDVNEIPLKPTGTEFRLLVWKLLCKIPYGKVITYGELAQSVSKITGNKKMSARAIGNAVGHNPISIIIPCHRVIGTNGKLTGYAAGIENKKRLLQLEGLLFE